MSSLNSILTFGPDPFQDYVKQTDKVLREVSKTWCIYFIVDCRDPYKPGRNQKFPPRTTSSPSLGAIALEVFLPAGNAA